MSAQLDPSGALAAVLAGSTVRVVVGSDPDDPICLFYLDRCAENDYEPMIYLEAIRGWSEGAKEAVCEPGDPFFVRFLADPPALSISTTEDAPVGRESSRPVAIEGAA